MAERAHVMLVTGSTDGIGKQTAIELARSGAVVIVHGRSAARTNPARDEVARLSGSAKVEAIAFDLSSLDAVRTGAAELLARHSRLDVLVHNAGVFMTERRLSADGHELTFAVNHLAPFLLTHLLAKALDRAAPARVITVSSVAHTRGRIRFDDLEGARDFDGYTAYAQSKLANVMFAFALARKHDAARLTSNALHPGVVTTKLLKEGFGSTGVSVERGAATSVHLALSPEVAGVTGHYFSDRREARVAPAALDVEAQERLWTVSARHCGL